MEFVLSSSVLFFYGPVRPTPVSDYSLFPAPPAENPAAALAEFPSEIYFQFFAGGGKPPEGNCVYQTMTINDDGQTTQEG
jgi:hypothetical protein